MTSTEQTTKPVREEDMWGNPVDTAHTGSEGDQFIGKTLGELNGLANRLDGVALRAEQMSRDSLPSQLASALVEAVRLMPRVEYTKPKPGSGINYEYLSEEDLVIAARTAFPANGLVLIPSRMKLLHREVYQSNKGGRMVNYLILVTYRLLHCSGESIIVETIGEGADHGDKAMNKAMTGSYKYAIRQVLLTAGGLDPDHTSSDQVARASRSQPQSRSAAPSQSRTAESKPAPSQSTPATGTSNGAKPTPTAEERVQKYIKLVGEAKSHGDVRTLYQQASKAGFVAPLLAKVGAACAARETKLFCDEIASCDDLEKIEQIVHAAVAAKLGEQQIVSVREAARVRSEAVFNTTRTADEGPPADDGANEVAEMQF